MSGKVSGTPWRRAREPVFLLVLSRGSTSPMALKSHRSRRRFMRQDQDSHGMIP